jgi:putative ABC transport system permease protein
VSRNGTTSPPAAAERVLAAALGDGEWTESIVGDLYEEHASRAARNQWRADAWYCITAARLSVLAVTWRTRSRPRPRSAGDAHPPPIAVPLNPGDSLMRTIGLETRHAFRSIVKRPLLSGTVVMTMALGLGANAAVFSMVDALVLRPYTMPDVDRMAIVSYTKPDDIDRRESVSPADYLDMKRQADVFERFAIFEWWTANLVGTDEPENVLGFKVSSDFFAAIGVEPAIGRSFRPEEETPGRDRQIILGDALWQRRFAADRGVIGRSIEVDGQQREVVGVMPPGFDFPMGSQLWAPNAFSAETAANRRSTYLTVVGRLAAGRSLSDAKTQLAVIGERLTREHQDTNRGRQAQAYTLAQGMGDAGVGPILSMWQASAAFVLLICCANVASLLLARGVERQREMAVRLAMGASRVRVVREMLLESGLLAAAAVPGALAVAWVSLKVISAYMPPTIARFVAGWGEMDVDYRLIAFTCALAVLTSLVFGLVPALQASRPRLTETLKDGGRGTTAGGAKLRLRRGLVIAEIALALPLLVAAGLSVVTVQRFLNGPQGFNPDGVLTMRLMLPQAKYEPPAVRIQFVDEALGRLRAMPGVQAASASNVIPAITSNWSRTYELDGQPIPAESDRPNADYRTITDGFFTTLGIPILRGRGFGTGDRADTQRVAIVSESMAKRHWPGADPIGQRLRFSNNEPWVTVVGVSGDVIHNWFGRHNYPTVHVPYSQSPSRALVLTVRATGDPDSLAAGARAAVRAVDRSQPLYEVHSMRENLRVRTIGLQYVGAIMLVFGGLALGLAVIGIYGVMAYMVSARRHEIGVRMALGATRADVLRLTVKHSASLTAIGVGLGIALAMVLNRLIEAALFGLTSTSLVMVAGLAAVLAIAALAAGYFPARRAASLDPSIALRD